jgi:hypothetical protein
MFSLILFLPLCVFTAGPDDTGLSSSEGDEVNNATGTVQRVSPGADWYVIVPDHDPTERFLPKNLPDDFRKDGLRVLFSGTIGEIPPNVRLVGTPFELKQIERID